MSKDLGIYTQSFAIPVAGLEITAPCNIHLGNQGIKATLSTGGGQLEIALEIHNIEEESAPQVAIKAASVLCDSLMMKFAEYVEHVGHMTPSGSRFSPNSQLSSPRITINTSDSLRIGVDNGGVTAYRPDSACLTSIGHSVGIKLQVAEIPTSADLYTAKEMFYAGLRCSDKVARFLILYSAVGLMVMFCDGGKQPTQDNIDALLKNRVNPSLQFLPKPNKGKKKGKTKSNQESVYTKIRNDFVHAEERGKNPSAAKTAIEAKMKDFQRDVATLLMSS
jgi:hypothetical protein